MSDPWVSRPKNFCAKTKVWKIVIKDNNNQRRYLKRPEDQVMRKIVIKDNNNQRRFLKCLEDQEEKAQDIIGAVRLSLCFKLKSAAGVYYIMEREKEIVK